MKNLILFGALACGLSYAQNKTVNVNMTNLGSVDMRNAIYWTPPVVTVDPAGACTNAAAVVLSTASAKQFACLSGVWTAISGAGGSGTVFSVGVTVPSEFQVTGSPVTGTGTIAITKANASANMIAAGPASGAASPWGFRALVLADIPDLSSILQPFISAGTNVQYYRGDKTFQTLNTSAVAEGSSLYYLDSRARAAVSAAGSILYNSGTGTFTCQTATGTTAGCVTAADWTAFNAKQAALGFTPLNPANNLSDVGNAATARTNLGLGSAATQASSAFQAALGFTPENVANKDGVSGYAGLTAGSLLKAAEFPAVTGDVTISAGTTVSTVASAGGSSAANLHAAELLANAATNLNTASAIVKRDPSGNFAAGTIIASLTGQASLNEVPLTFGTGLSRSSNTVVVPSAGILNAMLLNPSLTVTAGTGLTGGGVVALGSSVSISMPGVGTAGTYTKVTTDAQGRVSSGATATAADVGAVPVGRLLNTTAPLTGGGDLSADRTLGIPAATSSIDGYLGHLDWATFNGKQSALGYTPLNPANNLSEVTPATARTNLGLGTAATAAASSFEPTITAGTQDQVITGLKGLLAVAHCPDTGGNHLNYSTTTHLLICGSSGSGTGAVASVFGRTGAVVPASGDYTAAQVTNAVDSTGSYSNPAWLTALAGAKVSGNISGNAANVTATVGLANGGTNANLSATGGAHQVLQQTAAGAAITAGQLAAADISGLGTAATQPSSAFQAAGTYAGVGNCSAGQYETGTATGTTQPCSQVAYSQLSGAPTLFNQTLDVAGTPVTQRPSVNFSAEFSVADNSGLARTDVSINSISGAKVTGLAPSATTDATNASNISSGTLADGRLSGRVVLNNQVNTYVNQAAPATPAAGSTALWNDSTDKNFKAKNDAGSVSVTVQPASAVSHQFVTAISSAGVVGQAQPSYGDLSGVLMHSQLGDFLVTRTTTVLTVGANCSVSTPCNFRFGSSVFSITASATVTISAGTGTVYIYVTSSGTLTAGHNVTLTCSAGCFAQSGITSPPTDSIPLFSWSATSGGWDVNGGTDQRAFLSAKKVQAGSGLTSSESGGTTTIAFDTTSSISGNASTATALATAPTKCAAGNYPLGIDVSGNAQNCTAAGGGGATPTRGLFASAFACNSGNTGKMYLVRDDSLTGECDGSTMAWWAFGNPVTLPPAPGSFIGVGAGTITASPSGAAVIVTSPTASTDPNMEVALLAIPAGTSYDLTLGFQLLSNANNVYATCGLSISDGTSTSNKMVANSIGLWSSQRFVENYTTMATGVSHLANADGAGSGYSGSK